MYSLDSDKVPVTLHDFSAQLCEEEWTLLHEWQKELYRNVMKEIHQALIALGCKIHSTLLRMNGAEEGTSNGAHDSETRKNTYDLPSEPDIAFMMKLEEEQDASVQCSSEEMEIITIQDPGERMVEPNVVFKINDVHPQPNNSQHSQGREKKDDSRAELASFNANVHWRKEEEPVSVFLDYAGAEIGDRSGADTCSDYEVVSVCIKNEMETYCTELPESGLTEGISSPSGGEEGMNTRQKGAYFNKHTEIITPCKAFSEKFNTLVPQRSNNEMSTTREFWPECYQELGGERTEPRKKNFSNPVRINLHQKRQVTGQSNAYNEFGSNLKNSKFPGTQLNQKTYPFTESVKKYSLKGENGRRTRTQLRARPYACTECEKRFSEKRYLVVHSRIHTGEKPYMCTFCFKSFNRKDNLNGHIRIHTGERPYACTKCEKSFRQQNGLKKHQQKFGH